ncbi:hypothetical protein [Bremerella sp. P1]|uniref:hypothetical protein n=1 Tax=Bremerella sp. P1 TaxID=3026424 RepID=UPI002368941B|nr:hypothetical protein [Bremerella sp. P1]WDI40222.1 hypothetical protein PSR63_17215 [Bremerella sp. P1]
MTPEWVSAISSAVCGFGTLAAVLVAFFQLRKLNKSVAFAGLANVIQLERDMCNSKEKLDEINNRIRTECHNNPDPAAIEILEDLRQCYLENWLNTVDRLAYCIIKKHLDDREWKVEYRPYINTVINSFPEEFGVNSIYTNTIDLHDKWKRS